MDRYGFYFDNSRCTGCKTCQLACAEKSNSPLSVNYRKVPHFVVGKYPDATVYHVSQACNHCENPACVEACPTRSMHVDEADGTVQHDDDKCIGCKMCMMACPYGAPQYLEKEGITGKCNACIDTRAEDGAPTCVAACGMRALDFGKISDLENKYPNAVIGLPCLPDPSITNPQIRIKAKENALQDDFQEVLL